MSDDAGYEEMDRLEAKLSPEGRALVEEIRRRSAASHGALSPAEALGLLEPRIQGLSDQDRSLFVRWAAAGVREGKERTRQAKEGEAYAHAAVDAIHRAQELEILDGKDPTSEALKGMTVAQAVEVLERHGEELPRGLFEPGRPQGWRSQGDGWTISGYLRSTSKR